jgi:ribonuclease P protein component
MVFVLPRQLDPTQSAGADQDMPTRLGITVTRKVGNAVARNRIKRLVREVFRQHRARLPPGLDIVWVAKQQAAGASFAEVLDDFEALLRRSELTGPPSPRNQAPRNQAPHNQASRNQRGPQRAQRRAGPPASKP